MSDATHAEDFNTLAHDVKNLIEKDTSFSHDDALALTKRLEKFSNSDNEDAYFASTLSTALHLRATISPTDFVTVQAIGQCIGSGSFATVYRGVWNDQEVAVKIFRSRLLEPSNSNIVEDTVKSFTREFRAWKTVSGQPKLWKLHGFSISVDVEYEDVRLLLVSPLAEGDLTGIPRVMFRNKDQIFTFILDIALGLKTLHDSDIIHGDLRGSNILCYEGHCYLTDLGLSKSPTMSTPTTFAQMVERGWAAPELDQQTRSKQSDIFSFACTIYEMFTQKPPYEKDSIAKDRLKPPQRIGHLTSEDWNELWEILEVCWSADPLDRPTVSDLKAKLSEMAGRSFLRSSFLMADATQAEYFNTLAHDVKNLIEKDTSVSHDDALALTKRLEKFSDSDNEYALFASKLSTALGLRASISPNDFVTVPTIGQYIGSGSFGTVYQGVWNDQEVAVKVFHSQMLQSGNRKIIEDTVKSFTREFRAWKTVSGQPKLWKLHGFSISVDLDNKDVRLLLISPLAEGDLARIPRVMLRNKDQIVTFILDIALGLKTLHDSDIIHGDLRASNVLRSNGHCYLSDFGISQLPAMSTLGSFPQMVHAGWAAPELDEKSLRSKQSDIFSFACTIYEIITREPPYEGESCAKDRSKPPKRKAPLNRGEWDELWEVLVVCWSPDPSDRPTATKLEARLSEIAADVTQAEDFKTAIPRTNVLIGDIDKKIHQEAEEGARNLSKIPRQEITTCWIAAERALQHAKKNLSSVFQIFDKCQIPKSDYVVLAGFDESLVKSGVGYLEQIHVFTIAEVNPSSSESLFTELGRLFSPFSSSLFTESSSYRLPVFKDDGSQWEFDELIYLTVSKFADDGSSAEKIPPTIISLPLDPSSASSLADASGFSQPEGGSGSGEGERDKDKGKAPNNNANKDDKNSSSEPTGNGPPGDGDGDGTPTVPDSTREIIIIVDSEIYIREQDEDPSQTLTTRGNLTIETKHKDPQYSERIVKSTAVEISTVDVRTENAYKLIQLRVFVDSREPEAECVISKTQPKTTPDSNGEIRHSSSTRSGSSNVGTGSFQAGTGGLQGVFSRSSTRQNETSEGFEEIRYTSPITRKDIDGKVWWDYGIVVHRFREHGYPMPDSILPTVHFKFDNMAPPMHIDIVITSYWSKISPIQSEPNRTVTPIHKLLHLFKSDSESIDKTQCISFSNLFQIVALTANMDNLKKRNSYKEKVKMYLDSGISGFPQPEDQRPETESLKGIEGKSVVVNADRLEELLKLENFPTTRNAEFKVSDIYDSNWVKNYKNE